MNSDTFYDLEEIGIPILPGNAEQIELFEKFLDALEAGRDVDFTQTAGGLKLRASVPLDPIDEDQRRLQIKLIHRSLAILKAGLRIDSSLPRVAPSILNFGSSVP